MVINKNINNGVTPINKNVTIMEIEGLNHLFQDAATRLPSEYQNIEETFSPKALKILSDWISERVNKQ